MITRRKVWRAIKYATLLGMAAGTGYVLRVNDWDVSTVGVMRFGRAAFTAVRIAVDYKYTLHGLDDTTPGYQELKSQIHWRSAESLRKMCCANGGGFIKVGQHIGSLEYLLPTEYVQTMKVLHSQAPQSKLEDLYKVIEEDLGVKVEDVFEEFEPEPLGAASLAQVHRATLKDGRVLAVKVQHPHVKRHSFVDIKTMEVLVHGIAWIFPGFQYMWIAEEVKRNLPVELDFVCEGKNCEQVGRVLKHFDFLKIPKIHWDLSSERVLTMEFCEGGKVDDREYMKKHDISTDEISRNLGKLYSEMIFVQGYVHCDPHPGNVLVNKTPKGTEIVLLDHGLYQTLTDDFRINYCKMWLSLINFDIKGIEKYARKLNVGNYAYLFACMLTARSWDSIKSGLDKTQITDAENNAIKENAVQYLIEISEILNKLPRQMLLILKTNDVLRGIEYSLKTHANATSFLNMSRCCVKAVATERLRKCTSWTCRIRIYTGMQWQLCKIRLYEMYLWLTASYGGHLLSRFRQLTFSR